MTKTLKMIRAVSLGVILAGMAVLGTSEPAEAGAFYCQFCVSSCPQDLEQYCANRGCETSWAACEPVHPDTPGTCQPYTQYQVQCNLI